MPSRSTAKIDLGYNPLELEQTNWTVSSWFLSPINHPDDQATGLCPFESPGYPTCTLTSPVATSSFYDRNPPSPDFFASSLSGSINDPDWHLVTLTSALNQFIVYIDGVEVTRYTGAVQDLSELFHWEICLVMMADLLQQWTTSGSIIAHFLGRSFDHMETATGTSDSHLFSIPPTFDNVPEILLPKKQLHTGNLITLKEPFWTPQALKTMRRLATRIPTLTFSRKFDRGRNGKAISLVNDITVQCILDETEEYLLKRFISLSFWLNTQDRDASIVSSGRFNIYLADGYLNSNLYMV